MDTSLEHTHELEPHIRVARARAGVLLLIVSDVLAVLAILAAGGYLRALNTRLPETMPPPSYRDSWSCSPWF
jgi:hypothetical protein